MCAPGGFLQSCGSQPARSPAPLTRACVSVRPSPDLQSPICILQDPQVTRVHLEDGEALHSNSRSFNPDTVSL